MDLVIYHNPRCSKSRQTLELLRARGCKPVIVDYLREPPDTATLTALLRKLGLGARQIMRDGEEDFIADRDVIAGMSETECIDWLSRHPRALQRPIVVSGDSARIGRPPEAVLEILR